MRAFLVLAIVLVAAATALAYGHAGVSASVSAVASHASQPTEPAVLLLSGSALLGLAGAVRRLRL